MEDQLKEIAAEVYQQDEPEKAFDLWLSLARDDKERWHMTMARDGYISDELEPYVKMFRYDVWAGGMHARIDECEKRGIGGTFGNTHVMTFTMCGRTIVTLQGVNGEDDSQVSFTMIEDDATGNRGGIRSFNGSIFAMRQRIFDLVENWPKSEREQREVFKPEPDISYCGVGQGT